MNRRLSPELAQKLAVGAMWVLTGVTIGVLQKLVKNGTIKKGDVTVAYVTGNGLKTQEAVVDAVGRPVRILPSLVAFERTFRMGKNGGGDI